MRNHKGNMLLVELTIVLLFFAVSQAIILQVFVKAQEINRDATLRNNALLKIEDTAEMLAASQDAATTLLSLGFVLDEEVYTFHSLDGFQINAALTRLTQPAGVLTSVELAAYQGERMLFSLPALQYRGGNST